MTENCYLHKDLTHEIIGAAMEVHRILGNGFLESVYEESLAIELMSRDITFEQQRPLDVIYKGKLAKQFFCDLLVNDKILVELKAIKKLTENEYAQVLNYMKATGLELGLLINFGTRSLEFKRVINNQC
ncbi:MAG: GxxExxY protein [Phycisphaerae bacterium]|nr:GxxExxY protein [Phycisphaerae bacterium]